MALGFRYPELSNIWKAQAGLSSLKKGCEQGGRGKHLGKAVY